MLSALFPQPLMYKHIRDTRFKVVDGTKCALCYLKGQLVHDGTALQAQLNNMTGVQREENSHI